MSTQSAIDLFIRYNRIINVFKSKLDCDISLHEVKKVFNGAVSERTLRNYFEQINDIGYSIVKGNSKGTYRMTRNDGKDLTEAFDNLLIAHSITKENKNGKILFTTAKEYRGTDQFFPLKDAIKGNFLIRFSHFDFKTGATKEYRVQPYALKENRGRWYLLGFKCDFPNDPRSFGLDRISNLMVESETFTPKPFDWEAHYNDCYAMYAPAQTAERVVFSLDTHDANYVRFKPMHHSQKELSATADRVRFELNIKIAKDFLMELMSRSWSIQVEEPASLRDTLTKHWQEAIDRHR